jgi:hypothetical protein
MTGIGLEYCLHFVDIRGVLYALQRLGGAPMTKALTMSNTFVMTKALTKALTMITMTKAPPHS